MFSEKVNGFTLLELLTVVALVAIVATLAVPSYKHFINKNKVEAAANEFSSLVRKARKLAIVNAKTVNISIVDNVFEISGQIQIPEIKFKIPDGVSFKKENIGNKLYFNRQGMLADSSGRLLNNPMSIKFCEPQVAKEVKVKPSLSVEIYNIDSGLCN